MTHETNQVIDVIICSPFIPAIKYANTNISTGLYNEIVNPDAKNGLNGLTI